MTLHANKSKQPANTNPPSLQQSLRLKRPPVGVVNLFLFLFLYFFFVFLSWEYYTLLLYNYWATSAVSGSAIQLRGQATLGSELKWSELTRIFHNPLFFLRLSCHLCLHSTSAAYSKPIPTERVQKREGNVTFHLFVYILVESESGGWQSVSQSRALGRHSDPPCLPGDCSK